jgi:hypothetical protein
MNHLSTIATKLEVAIRMLGSGNVIPTSFVKCNDISPYIEFYLNENDYTYRNEIMDSGENGNKHNKMVFTITDNIGTEKNYVMSVYDSYTESGPLGDLDWAIRIYFNGVYTQIRTINDINSVLRENLPSQSERRDAMKLKQDEREIKIKFREHWNVCQLDLAINNVSIALQKYDETKKSKIIDMFLDEIKTKLNSLRQL